MPKISVTPEQMNAAAGNIDGRIQEWNAATQKIYQLVAEMDTMWDGLGNDSFNNIFNADKPKFQNLVTMMTEYTTAIKNAATNYSVGEENVKTIVTRR